MSIQHSSVSSIVKRKLANFERVLFMPRIEPETYHTEARHLTNCELIKSERYFGATIDLDPNF